MPLADIPSAPVSPLFEWFTIGLGVAFGLAVLFLFGLLVGSYFISGFIDRGYLGLLFLLTVIVFCIAFTVCLAAFTAGWEIKLAVAVVDGLLVIASRLLSDTFLHYLNNSLRPPKQGSGSPTPSKTPSPPVPQSKGN